MSQQIGGKPYATRNKVPPDSDDSGNGGDARGMLYHAKGGMRSAATDVVPDRHANSVSPSHSGSHAIVNTEIAAQ